MQAHNLIAKKTQALTFFDFTTYDVNFTKNTNFSKIRHHRKTKKVYAWLAF